MIVNAAESRPLGHGRYALSCRQAVAGGGPGDGAVEGSCTCPDIVRDMVGGAGGSGVGLCRVCRYRGRC